MIFGPPQGPGFSEMAKKVRTNVLEMRVTHLFVELEKRRQE
jgi:hypothetical protein